MNSTAAKIDAAPHNVEAEQQLLGALLVSPNTHVMLSPDHFYDPVHADIYRRICTVKEAGDVASPVTMRLWAEGHEGLKDLGGSKYLVRLAGAAITPSAAGDYAAIVRDMRTRRDVIEVLNGAATSLLSDDEDTATILSRVEMAVSVSDARSSARPVSMLAAATEAMEGAWAAYQGDDRGMTRSGIDRLDRLLGGFYPGEMVLMGGRPSMGKTAVALSIALNAARAGKHVAIASLEMSPAALATRAISEATTYQGDAVEYSTIRRGDLNEQTGRAVKAAAQRVAELPITFLPSEYQDVGALLAGVRQIARTQKVDLVIIDYAQLLKAPGKSRYEEITEISRSIKTMARTMELPVLALSQLSRAVEQRNDKRPMLSDLRESGQLEQDADAVIFCYRDEYYIERDRPGTDDMEEYQAWEDAMGRAKNKLELIVAKQRAGAIGTAHVMCNPALNKVWE